MQPIIACRAVNFLGMTFESDSAQRFECPSTSTGASAPSVQMKDRPRRSELRYWWTSPNPGARASSREPPTLARPWRWRGCSRSAYFAAAQCDWPNAILKRLPRRQPLRPRRTRRSAHRWAMPASVMHLLGPHHLPRWASTLTKNPCDLTRLKPLPAARRPPNHKDIAAQPRRPPR
jgi:hypothetical protein